MADPVMASFYTPITGGTDYANKTESALLKTGKGNLIGIFVASASSSPTIKLWDNTAGSGTVLVNTFTPIAGSWYPLPFPFKTGLFLTIGGTVDCTVSLS